MSLPNCLTTAPAVLNGAVILPMPSATVRAAPPTLPSHPAPSSMAMLTLVQPARNLLIALTAGPAMAPAREPSAVDSDAVEALPASMSENPALNLAKMLLLLSASAFACVSADFCAVVSASWADLRLPVAAVSSMSASLTRSRAAARRCSAAAACVLSAPYFLTAAL